MAGSHSSYLLRVILAVTATVLPLPPVSSLTTHREEEVPVPAWLTWTVAVLAVWALLGLVVGALAWRRFPATGCDPVDRR
jgi:hypothetical protein